MGASYRALLDEARHAHAVEYVICTEMRSERIAGLLGFSDVRSFRRAFKRWTGNTPAGYRVAENERPRGA
jgi:AraC-like DNA-binding protein